jgi:hypothetical protein
MLLLFAALCFASIASILLYVIVHGLEQGSWELRFPAALAAALPVAVLLLAGLRRPSRLRELSPRTLAALASGLTGLCLLLELLHVLGGLLCHGTGRHGGNCHHGQQGDH